MIVLFLLRRKHGPAIIMLVGMIVAVLGVIVTRHTLGVIIGALLIVIGAGGRVVRSHWSDSSRSRHDSSAR